MLEAWHSLKNPARLKSTQCDNRVAVITWRALLDRPDWWCARSELSEAESFESLAGMPERCKSNRVRHGRSGSFQHPHGPSCSCVKRTAKYICCADYRTHCGGIPPGGSASIACLKRNARTLSGACQQALGAGAGVTSAAAPTLPPPPPEPAPLLVTPREELFMLRTACGADYAAFCRGLRPGAGRIAACLHYNSASLSPRCQQALVALREGR